MSGTTLLLAPPAVGQRFVLEGADWPAYEMALALRTTHPAMRVTFDGRRLELMTTSPIHEQWKMLLGYLVFTLTAELQVPVRSFGQATWRRQAASAGLEADQCYYIQSLARIDGVREPDLTRHPPPDLAIEVEHTRSVLDRLEIYARLRFPEVWRFDGTAITVLRLGPAGYTESPVSGVLPAAPLAEMARLLGRVGEPGVDDGSLVGEFREWLRANLAPPA